MASTIPPTAPIAGGEQQANHGGRVPSQVGGVSAPDETPRQALTRLAERFRLTSATLRLIAQAQDGSLRDRDAPTDGQIAKVVEAIEVFVLAGLDADQLIARAITEQRERGGERWREQLWSELLLAASEEWDRRGRPEPPLGPWLVTVPPIPPQPAEEIAGDDGHGLAA